MLSKRLCFCKGEHCFNDAPRCQEGGGRDAEGYPRTAKRRLSSPVDGLVRDLDDGQVFKCKVRKKGTCLVPRLQMGTKWEGAGGFAAMLLLLSCLGSEGEYVLWDETARDMMAEKEWKRRKFNSGSKPPIFHRQCEEVVTSTCIASLTNGQRVGCTCNSTHANHWRDRRAEAVVIGRERGFEVVTKEDEWVEHCTGAKWCPKLQCTECKEEVTTTCIASVTQGGCAGCRCNFSLAKHWCRRMNEVVAFGRECGFEVVTTEEEWVKHCTGKHWCPRLRCTECKEEVTSTCIASLAKGVRAGCSCHSNLANHWRDRRAEAVAIGRERGFEVATTEEEWVEQCTGANWCPKLQCTKCKEEVTTTYIASLTQGGGAGCSCNSTHAKHWRNRRDEAVAIGREREFEVVTTEEEWMKDCTGNHWCPRLSCTACKEEVTSTCIANLAKGGGVGCSCNSNHANHWCNRRDDLVEIGRERNFEVVTTRNEWLEQCTGSRWCPKLRCIKCKEEVTSTSINNIKQDSNAGCSCNSTHANHWRDRRSEVVDLGHERKFEVVTTECEWVEQCTGNYWCPVLRCTECEEEVTVTSICNLTKRRNVGCSCHSTYLNHWRDRRSEVVEVGYERNFEVVTGGDEWVEQCTGATWCPKLRCTKCKEEVTCTRINSLTQGCGAGCSCNLSQLKHWRNRRAEVVAFGRERGYEVVATEDEWVDECSGSKWCPTLRCTKCKEEVTSTCVQSLNQGGGAGCGCRNKTECFILKPWLEAFSARKGFGAVGHNTLKYYREITKRWCPFDFVLEDIRAIVELDGNIPGGHFDDDPANDTPQRDLEKEVWARERGYQVIRLLQEDVWLDRNGWDNWLATQLTAWAGRRAGGTFPGPATVPDDPLYLGGRYAALRVVPGESGQ
jgi:hypothetical protein